MSHSKFSKRLDKIERSSLESSDLARLWLVRVRNFKNAADYAEWFSDPAKSAPAVAVFERQVLNVLRRAGKTRWSPSRFEMLYNTILSLHLFAEVNHECAQGCDQLLERLRNLAGEAREIFSKLRGKGNAAGFEHEGLRDRYLWAAPGLWDYLAFDWYKIEVACGVVESRRKVGGKAKGHFLQQLKEALDKGVLEEGQMVLLPTIPFPELRAVPVVNGDWVNWFFITLALYGAGLKTGGGKPSAAEAKKQRDEAAEALTRSGVETKEIGGTLYVRLSDYVHQTDNLNHRICTKGITLASLLSWCDGSGNQAGDTETNCSAMSGGTGLTGAIADSPPASTVTCLARKMSPELAPRAQKWAEGLRNLVTDVNALSCFVGDCERAHFGGRSVLFEDVAPSWSC